MTSKFALVIANTEYQDESFAKLTAPGKDADEFAQVLRESAAFDDVQVLINEGESRTRRSIARFFAERKRDDLLLLYFSGHGVRNEQGHLFLAANDTEINILEASGIPAEFVTQSMNNSRSQRQLLILDCCNSGAFAHGSKSAAGVGKSMGIATAFEGSGFGRVVLTATDATQFAWEGDKVIGDTQKSVFTHFLIEGLKGEADRDGDGRIHIDELYDYAYEQVVRRTPKQTPGKWSYKQQGDIVLRENLKPREVKPAPLPPDLLELLSHPNSSVRKVGIQDLISLLDGKHQGLARAAQEKLQEIAVADDSLTIRRTASDVLGERAIVAEHPIAVGIPNEKKEEVPVTQLLETYSQREEVSAIAKVFPSDEERKQKPVVRESKSTPAEVGVSRRFSNKKISIPNLNFRLVGGIVGGGLLLTLFIWGASYLGSNLPASGSEPTRTSEPVETFTSQPVNVGTAVPSPSPSPTLISPTQTSQLTNTPSGPTPTLGVGSNMTSEDGMTLLYVPAGEFTMGSNGGGNDEKPLHTVYLDAFWIDQTEVTNKMYSLCVNAGVCMEPVNKMIEIRNSVIYFGNPLYNNYPIVSIDWYQANSYCEWTGRRLPTEAEWEKSARGTDERIYPWGNDINCSYENFVMSVGNNLSCLGNKKKEVGFYPNSASPFGVLDMGGNVREWVADRYASNYYSNSPFSNPLGPESGESRVLRGGTYDFGDPRSSSRAWGAPGYVDFDIGFRCAMSATP